MATTPETLSGSESVACREMDRWRNWGRPWDSHRAVSSGSEARMMSDRHGSKVGRSARSTEEAGQCPRRKGAEQDSLLDEGYTAAPEAEPTVSTKLAGLVARARKEARLTNVVQFVDEELLRLAFRSLRKQAAPGVDGQSYEDYAANLDRNLRDLYARLKSGRYQAPVIRRVHIPKGNGKRRPIGISTIEDRVVQKAVAWVLSAVFEQDFLESSHGFRPKRSPHTALHRLREGMRLHGVCYVVEADLASYFDSVNWAWLRKFVQHRVNDGGLLRLLNKWLKAGVMENGVVTQMNEGVPQGGPVSPVLSNVYLHYVLDLWFERRFRKACQGYAELTRFADDFVATFQNREDAERFRQELDERLAAFGLRVVPEKTAMLRFDGSLLHGGTGRPAERPGTFTFLGFTHYLTKTRRGTITIGRTPSVKARERFVRKVTTWVKANRHQPVRVQQAHLTKMLNGHYQYFGLYFCTDALSGVLRRVREVWHRALQRRSQKAKRHTDWATVATKPWFQLPKPRLTQAWV
jgi:RNA-directed DNA polymerase